MATTTGKQVQTDRGLREEKNPFARLRLLGFEPIRNTTARDLHEKEKVAAAAKLATEAGRAFVDKGDDYKPLQPGESLWDAGFSRKRRDNILGGWA
jgi:hypothetical protein